MLFHLGLSPSYTIIIRVTLSVAVFTTAASLISCTYLESFRADARYTCRSWHITWDVVPTLSKHIKIC